MFTKKEKKKKIAHLMKETSELLTSNSRNKSYAGSSLRFIFLTLLQKYEIHIYKPKQQRNIDKRLFSACCETIINKIMLKDVLYLSKKGFNYNFKKHQFIVGWGNKNQYKKAGKFIKIPLYSLSDANTYIYDHSVPYWIFEEATFTHANVNTGYWVFWRDKDLNGELKDTEMIFVPAEESTMIPIDSSLEEKMLKYLVAKELTFKKPQIMDKGDDLLPDFRLIEEEPNTIVEVAGMLKNEDYSKRLNEKKQWYKKQGLKYIEWDGQKDLDLTFN